MVKPKARVVSAAIAGMLGVQAPPVDPSTAGHESGGGASPDTRRTGEGAHPVRDRSEAGIARAENALILDPRRIARRGTYVRPFTEDRRFRDLLTAITEAGRTIHVPVLVRVEGPPGSVEYVLVDGTHRLEAALRLDIPVPAVNLGRISAERAFAIQAMANEVRASMHVVDQAAYVLTLLGQGLTRETVQRTTGFSSGRVSELSRIGALLAALPEEERAHARCVPAVTHRALRTLVATGSPESFRQGLRALLHAATDIDDLDASGDEFQLGHGRVPQSGPSGKAARSLVSTSDQLPPQSIGGPRGRARLGAGGVSFAIGRNPRGTSVTFRMAWRARGVRADPDLFLERVRDALEAIAQEATAHYDVATQEARSQRRRGRGTKRSPRGWRDTIAREEAELRARVVDSVQAGDQAGETIPELENPIPVPPSRRRSGEPQTGISPRLLAGLSLPMLAERLKRRAPEYQQLESQLADVERQAEEVRQRARETLDRRSSSERPTARLDKDDVNR
jgi:hypothetical protein